MVTSNEVPKTVDTDRRAVLRFGGGLGALALVLSMGPANPALAAPEAKLWARWQAHDPASDATIDHADWGGLLDRHLTSHADGINRFDYGAVGAEDRAALDGYIETLTALPISAYNRDQQMAYWLNMYNALTVQVVLDHYPVDSIRDIDISPGFFSNGPWGKKLVTIEGEQVSLDDIEHQILRPIWQDPRIHYAVNCASIGCPNLHPEPFEAARLDQQMDQAAVTFVNHPRAVSIEGGRLEVSSIYDWFASDFGSRDQAVIDHLKRYAAPDLKARLDTISSIDGDDYDWRLNDVGIAYRSS